jgi:sterol 3beta-glucosyltransferase
MAGFDPSRMFDALVKALAGRRALISPGWSGVDATRLPDNFFVIGDTPHDWLFPRVAAVIHHGGSGTSHSAARAGVPSIVVPFAGDQFFWAERLRLVGVAPAPVDGRRPTGVAFARALKLVAAPSIMARAEALGTAMRAERGVADATDFLEHILAVRRSRSR